MMVCIQYEEEYFELESCFWISDIFDWLEENNIKYETDSAGVGPHTTHIINLENGSDYMATRLKWM